MQYAKLLCIAIISIFFFHTTTQIYAHGSGGELTKEQDGYTFDIGYEPEELSTSEPVNLDFKLLKDGTPVEFSDVWVRIEKGTQTIFATGIHKQNLGATTLLYQFPTGGTYTLNVRYQDNGETLSESAFPISITEEIVAENNSATLFKPAFIFGIIFAFILGAALGIITGRTTKLLK